MPEGHTVHRVARQFALDFVGCPVAASSPQGRFAAGAALLDGATMTRADAVGKQMFLTFTGDRWLRVHLGLYGAWEFDGQVSPQRSGSRATSSLGARRRRRTVRVGEEETALDGDPDKIFPRPPVGQVRVRLLTAQSVADLRGPTACEVLTGEEVAAVIAKAGPDPMHDEGPAAEAEFVRRLTRSRTSVGRQLMDQAVVSGIGNVYRAEMLFRARLNPHIPGKQLSAEAARELWQDWSVLLADGVRTGMMLTRSVGLTGGRGVASRTRRDRYWVYHRAGEPCRVCGTPIALELMAGRNLYWCPCCQA